MKKAIIALAVVTMFITIAGVATACGSNKVTLITDVSGNGEISVKQNAHKNVELITSIEVGNGRIDFDQKIKTKYGTFTNSVDLHGTDLSLRNMAEEKFVPGQGPVFDDDPMRPHREVTFMQDIYMGESCYNYDAAKSVQTFKHKSIFIKQKVEVCPTDGSPEVEPDRLMLSQSGIMNSKFMSPEHGGRATLMQMGSMHADYDLAKQWTNANGGASSVVKSVNNDNWVDFSQMLVFSRADVEID